MSRNDPNDGGAINHFASRDIDLAIDEITLNIINNLFKRVLEMAHTVDETLAGVQDMVAKFETFKSTVDAIHEVVLKLKASTGLSDADQASVDSIFNLTSSVASEAVDETAKVADDAK